MSVPAPPPPAPPAGSDPGAGARLEIRTSFLFLSFLLYFFPPTIVLDGVPHKVQWGTQPFDVWPGSHRIEVYFRYLFGDMGRASIGVAVSPGQTVRITYRAPWLVFLEGKIRQV